MNPKLYRNPTFEDYLATVFANESLVLDDDLPDATNNWIADLDPQELIDYAEAWGVQTKEDFVEASQKFCNDMLNSY